MKNTTYLCDFCRSGFPLSELIPVHFQYKPHINRDVLVLQEVDLINSNKHICENCLADIAEVSKQYFEAKK